MKLVLSRRADADIADISSFTTDRWGVVQARQYVAGLMARLEQASVMRHPGRTMPGFPASLRQLKYRSHFVFFQTDGDRFLVIRVLHERMDVARHLAGG